MRLGVNLGYQGAGRPARAAEDLGYSLALAPEGMRSDTPSVLGLVAGATRRGIGDPDANRHYRLAVTFGHARQAAEVRRRLVAGDRVVAAAAVPAEFVDATALAGPVRRIARRMRACAEAGVTTLGAMISATATDVTGRFEQLRLAADTLDLSGAEG
ncbi:hypothetical protein ACWEWG_12715 [Streptomyces sp. NPDC003758]